MLIRLTTSLRQPLMTHGADYAKLRVLQTGLVAEENARNSNTLKINPTLAKKKPKGEGGRPEKSTEYSVVSKSKLVENPESAHKSPH